MKPNTKTVIDYLQAHVDEDFTAADLAEKLDIPVKSINGIFTSAIQRKGYGFREEVEVEAADGTHNKVKYLRLTDSGVALDTNADD